jgi:HD-like signal output (HDOD) protein
MSDSPDLKTLRRLRPLSEFSEEQLQTLANQLHVQTARKKEFLIRRGDAGNDSLFVLEGKVRLLAVDGQRTDLVVDDREELNPLAQLRPSMYDIVALGPVRYLRIDRDFLTQFAQLSETGDEDISVHMLGEEEGASPLTLHLYEDLLMDRLTLPSLPDVAHRIQQAYHKDDSDADQLAHILMTDPAISAKLIKVANSPVYSGLAATETLQQAIIRLGMDTTYELVMAYAVNELFQARTPRVERHMRELWEHSRKVAAISRVLAANSQLFDPEHAMLAGLVHDVGVIVILQYFQDYCDPDTPQEEMDETLQQLRPQVSGTLLRQWNFSEDMIEVAEESEQWFRNPKKEVDLCDLVLLAQYHSLMGTPAMEQIPPITTLPAMRKFNMGPQESIELIRQSQKEIREIEALLH